MPKIITFFVSGVLACLACLHFYWALGGKAGFYDVLPEKTDGQKLFLPTVFDCVFVGFALLGFGAIVWFRLPTFWKKAGLAGLALIFALRAVGEFRYVGFFKSIKHSTFAQLDTLYYAPLCALLSAMLLYLIFQYKQN